MPPFGRSRGVPASRHEPAERRPRPRDGHLLPEDRPHDELEAVERAGDADPGDPSHQWGHLRIGGEGCVDRGGVGVEVERTASAIAESVKVGAALRRDADGDVVRARRHRDHRDGARLSHGTNVRPVPNLLDARDGARAEERQERVGRERRPEGEPEGTCVQLVVHAGRYSGWSVGATG